MPQISKTQLVLTGIAIIAIGYFVFTHKAPTQSAGTTNSTPSALGTWPSVATDQETIKESTDQYTIDVVYPVAHDDRITRTFKQFVDDQIATFKSDTSWATDPSVAPAESQSLTLDITYQETRSKYADNYVFTVVTYTGGAHGLQATQTFVFDKDGNTITLDNLFTDKDKGLSALSQAAIKELTNRKVSDANWISEGAGPTPDNYQNFVLTDTGITIMFDPYQVAAYAAGPQQVEVPFTALKGVLDPAITQ